MTIDQGAVLVFLATLGVSAPVALAAYDPDVGRRLLRNSDLGHGAT